MKKMYYLILSFVLFTFSVKAQSGKIFPDSIALWTEFDEYLEDSEDQTITDLSYYMHGDTVINGVSYKNVYRISVYRKNFSVNNVKYEGTSNSGLSQKIGALRKEDKKVMFRFLDTAFDIFGLMSLPNLKVNKDRDYMLFDFGWTAGDTVFSEHYNGSNNAYLLIEKDTTVQGKRFLLFPGTTADPQQYTVLEEGVGFTRSLFFRLSDFGNTQPEDVRNSVFYGRRGLRRFCGDAEFAGYTPGSIPANDCQRQISGAMSAREVAKNNISVYPNPATDFLRIEGINENVEVQLSDILGKEIDVNITLSNTTATLDVSALPAGVYMLSVTDENCIFSQKIVKK